MTLLDSCYYALGINVQDTSLLWWRKYKKWTKKKRKKKRRGPGRIFVLGPLSRRNKLKCIQEGLQSILTRSVRLTHFQLINKVSHRGTNVKHLEKKIYNLQHTVFTLQTDLCRRKQYVYQKIDAISGQYYHLVDGHYTPKSDFSQYEQLVHNRLLPFK